MIGSGLTFGTSCQPVWPQALGTKARVLACAAGRDLSRDVGESDGTSEGYAGCARSRTAQLPRTVVTRACERGVSAGVYLWQHPCVYVCMH